jgi:hypothetical protein
MNTNHTTEGIQDEKQYRRGFDHGYNEAVARLEDGLKKAVSPMEILKCLRFELLVLNCWKHSVDEDVEAGRNLLDARSYHEEYVRTEIKKRAEK